MAAGTNLERTNWYQCSRFLIEGGRAILKDFFMKSYYPQTLDVFLNAKYNKDIIDSLCKKRILNQDQMNILFPNADIELFDITLLSCIILNCVIKGDFVKSDAVKEIRTLRNRVFGHICTLSMTENEFKTNWIDINTTLLKTKKELCVNVSLNELADGIKNEELVEIEYMERMKFTIETFTRFDDVLSDIEHLRQEQAHNFKEVNKSLTCIQKTTAESDCSIRDIKDTVKKVTYGLEEVKDELKRVKNIPIEVEGWSSRLHNSLVQHYKKYLIKSFITASSKFETDIDDIYAEPLLQLLDHKALCKSSFEKNKMPINLKDIFGNGDDPYYNIYVTGDAGMGKTSLTKYILSTWCNLHEKGEPLNDFELALKQYDFLFYIELRNATDQYYIEDMIAMKLLRRVVVDEPGELLKKIINSSKKCLIILDGLDEWTETEQSDVPSISNGAPGRNSCLQCTIITTTRPWKLDKLRLKESEIDRQIQVTGVQDVSTLGEKLINCLNIRGEKNMIHKDFASCLKKACVGEISKTPIILNLLISLWFNGKGLGQSKTEIYTNVIELWIDIAEKEKGLKLLKRIADIGIDETISTPDIFKKKGKCVRYKTILSAVAKLAFETSMHKEGRQLIFDSTVDHGLSEEQMKICLKVGILTQSTVPDITCERTSISFSHETFHEYFAALHTGWNSNIRDNIKTSFTDLTMSERGYYFIFLSGMWPLESVRLLERTMAKMFENCNTYNANELELICTQCLLRLCYIERMHQNESLKINLGSIHFNSSLYNIYMGFPLENSVSLTSKCKHFFSLISSMCQQNILQSRGDNFTFDFSKLCDLKCLWLSNIEADSLKVSSTLSYLYLNEVKIVTEDGMMDLMSSIANAKSLRSISILLNGKQNALGILIFLQSDIVAHLSKLRKISDKDILKIYESAVTQTLTRTKQTKQSRNIEYVIDLSKHSQLKYIELADIYIRELRLSPVTEVVVLQNLFLEQAKMFYLIKSLSSMHGLMELVLQTIGCAEHHNNEDCFLDLSNHTELRTVSLANISVSGLKVRQVQMSLRLINIKLANNGEIVSLMKSVTSAHGLKALIIENIYCAEHQNTDDCFLDLSNHNELRWVELTRISVSGLKIRPDTLALHLKVIKLANNGEIVSLMKSVSRTRGLEELVLEEIDCAEHQNNEDCFLDLSNHTELRIVSLAKICVIGLKVRPVTKCLQLTNIKLANNGEIVSLMKSVSRTHGLEVLVLQNIDCAEHQNNEDCFIDLSNHTELKIVELTRISVSGLKARPVTKCLQLTDIKLANNGEIVSLMKSVSRTHGLKVLVLQNIDCAENQINEDCFIDLSNHTELKIVELTRISVSGLKARPFTKSLKLTDIKLANNGEIVSLIKSVSRTHGLEELVLGNIDCSEHQNNENCFIDLSNHTKLRIVSLTRLSVSGLKLRPDTMALSLIDIKLANNGEIVSLMKSVSRTHGLEVLVLKNIDCAEHQNNEDCFLDLSNHTELRMVSLPNICVIGLKVRAVTKFLRLKDIKLANNGEIVNLMKSVSRTHGLEELVLGNIDCAEHQNNEDCFIDLSNHTELRIVELTRISVSGLKARPVTKSLKLTDIKLANNGEIVSLMKSVSRTRGLEVLVLQNIDCAEHQNNEDCIIDLSNHNELRIVELTRISVSGLKARPVTKSLKLTDIKLANNGEIVSLMKSVSRTHGLEVLVLQNIDCAEHQNNEDCFVDLSNHTELKIVELTRISVSGLKARPVTKCLQLTDIKLANNVEIVSLMKSVSRTRGLEVLVLQNIDCAEHQNNEDCFIDLSNHTELRIVELTRISVSGLNARPVTKSLKLIDIKLANNCEIVSLMKSVSRTRGLEELALGNIDCSEHQKNEYCFLDLSNHTELTMVALANISFSGLKVRAVTKCLNLINIKLANHGEIVSLLKSVSNMHRLEELVLENIYCAEHLNNEDCFIDLSNHTKLRAVFLSRISVSGLKLRPDTMVLRLIDIKLANNGELFSLMESVSSTHGLEVLILQNLDCVEHQNNEDCFLNLSNHSELRIVSLANIFVSGLKARPAMRCLLLKNIKMPNNVEIISLKESVLSTHTLTEVLLKNIYCAPK